MNNESKDMTSAASAISIEATPPSGSGQEIDQEQRYRASAYGLLAGMLRAAPDQVLLDRLGGLGDAGEVQFFCGVGCPKSSVISGGAERAA